MARGPFQGTWRPGIRPTVVTAPDAMVFFNGESSLIACGQCRRRFDWNKYITSIQIDLNVDSSPGSASVGLSLPRHSVDEFYFDGNPVITPMMEIEVYAKGYYLIEGLPQYYPIFWGLVTGVDETYSGGEHSFNVSCADILKWWELCKMNINPAFTQALGQQGRSIFGNVFFGSNPYDIIWTLAQQSFGDVVMGSGSLVSMFKEQSQKQTFNAALSDIMQYWNSRFTKIRSNLLLYGTQGTAVRGDSLYSLYQNRKPGLNKPFASQIVRNANGGVDGSQMSFDPTSPEVVAFRTQFSNAGQIPLWQSEYQTKMELANAAKEAIGYEFFMDVTGDIVFKPPFYNLDILSNKPISWIQDIDVIDWSLSESESEVITQLQLQGSYAGNVDYGFPEEATPFTSVTDYHLLRKYGWRTQTMNSEFSGDPQQMFYIGMDMLDRINSRRHQGSLTIPLRPELRLGFPVYLAPKDQVWYIQGISHNIPFGGRAQTTLTLTAKRQKFIAPIGIGSIQLTNYKGPKDEKKDGQLSDPSVKPTTQLSRGGHFKADVGLAAQLPPTNVPDNPDTFNPYAPLILRHPKTGRLVGYPNAVIAYTRPFNPTAKELAKVQGRNQNNRGKGNKNITNEAVVKMAEELAAASHTATDADRVREKHLNNRYSYGLNSAGVYTYLGDLSQVIQEMLLLPAANIDFGDGATKFTGSSGMIRPVSDERGFEVIGHFRYGRGVSLKDGSLVLSEGGLNSKADVGTQLALAGGLYESLQAQSQGLTTISTPFPNPASAIANLAPEDLQTAGRINPETFEPEFVNTKTNFVNTAPLGSPENMGSVVNVEASQLSRALTLAEMSIKEDRVEEVDCACLTGRSDLAFMNVGYQLQYIDPTTGDNTSIKYGALDENNIAAVRDAVDRGKAIGEAAESSITTDQSKIDARSWHEILVELDSLPPEVLESGVLGEAIRDGKPVVGNIVGKRSQVISRVENFLASLYTVLGDTHHAYEKELRGEHIKTNERTPEQVRFGTEPEPEPSPFSPPFSAPSRAAGGDPAALAIQGESAIGGLTTAWSEFGDKLRSSSEKTKLESEIDILQRKITDLKVEKERLEETERAGGTIRSPDGGVATQLENLEEELAQAQKDYDNKRLKLNLLNQRM